MGEEMKRAEAFAQQMVQAYAGAVTTVLLYGSAARGDYQQGKSDLNLLVLLSDASPQSLRRGSALARQWVEKGNPPPLVLAADEWRRSADVFPIEYADIRDAHRVLMGTDPFLGLEITRENLRLQCEHELKGKLIQLREGYLLSANQPQELAELLQRSFSTFLVLFRTVLRLAGAAVPHEPERVLDETAARVGFDAAPLHRILRARHGVGELRPTPDDPVVVGYLAAVAQTAAFIDRLA